MSVHGEEGDEEEEPHTAPFATVPGIPWAEALGIHLREFKAFNPTDRLGYVHAIAKMIAVTGVSVNGWRQWLEQYVMTLFTQEQLKQIYDVMREHVVPLLEMDKAVTEEFEKRHRPQPIKEPENNRKYA